MFLFIFINYLVKNFDETENWYCLFQVVYILLYSDGLGVFEGIGFTGVIFFNKLYHYQKTMW